ncbi:hypothetical protein ABZY19_27290 [Streptomyces sp. NPDC006475]|uniref:Uncharacterized protein n=1 Tax=Streptomyces achmelvichensis TaxID=3134111 RepID=A0ACC6PRP6_9ACTN|nr:hypothetical protein OG317_08420 [Streptomyces sp. NBC_01167]
MSLPGADELFRTTGGMALNSSSPRRQANGEPRVPAPAGESDPVETADASASPASSEEHSAAESDAGDEGRARSTDDAEAKRRPQEAAAGAQPRRSRGGRGANRRPSGRERHDEKITVYVSAEELMDLEHARLVLRGEHGLAVDRGRIVREAVAVVLADLEQRGDASILVRRLRGR